MKKELLDRIEYRNDKGQLHRDDGLPAVEWNDGGKSWWINGQLHRLDGPAREWNNGAKEWFINDKRHREDGPAIEYPNGSKSYYLNNISYTEDQFHHEVIKLKLNRLVNEKRTSR